MQSANTLGSLRIMDELLAPLGGSEGEDDIEARVIRISAEQLGISEDTVREHMGENVEEAFGGDSLDIVAIIVALETEFNIHIPDEEEEPILTISGAIENVKMKVGVATSSLHK